MNKIKYKILFGLSSAMSILILVISANGLSDSLYTGESESWRIQCIGQDLIDLILITPCLMISALLMLNGYLIGRLVWPGVMLYLVYTFVIYCFDVHFNSFFIEYCVTLGLGIYSLIYFLYAHREFENVTIILSSKWFNVIAVYLFSVGIAFYFIWLAQIVPAIRAGNTPNALDEINLPTNPVHVLDLSILLPLFILTSVLLFRKKELGLNLAAVLLVFSVLMDITILVLDILQEDNFAMRLIFILLSIASITFFIALFRVYKKINVLKDLTLWLKSE